MTMQFAGYQTLDECRDTCAGIRRPLRDPLPTNKGQL